jgi:uncharacterized membrane protein
MRKNSNQRILQTVELAILLALVVVLQMLGGFIKFGPFSLSLVLIPVVIGSVLLGAKGGAILGATFGAVVVIQCATGVDAGGFILWGINPILTALICIVKGAAAGFVPGIIYKALTKNSNDNKKKEIVAAVLAAASAPIINTGLFLIGLSLFFYDTLVAWAGGTQVLAYVFTGLVGINFIVELIINIVLAPVISSVVKAVTK